MAALDTLPVELVANIANYLPPQDVKTLSRASWFMRHAVVGVLFRTLVIPCPLASTRSLEDLIHKYQDFISRVYLHIYLRPNMEEKPHQSPMPSVWGTASSDTLKRIVRGEILSNISSFVVEFDAGQFEPNGWWGENGWWGASDNLDSIIEDEENWDQTLQKEREMIWRAQYSEVMRTISSNQNITNFKMSNLLPKNASAWESPEWESFLGRLQVLDISVFGGDDGACWHTLSGFADFIENLPHFVMRHARNVKQLILEASPDGIFGTSSRCHQIPLPLKKDHFLFLRSLKLKNIMIGPELEEFLTSRVDSFEKLELHDCMCNGSEWELVHVTWGGLWRAIRERNMRLRKVSVVQSRRPPLMWREDYSEDFETSEDSVAAARVRKILEEDRGLVLWRYAKVDYKYGWVVDLSDDNIKRFEEGEDQREYVKLLMVLEERNKQRG
ncbi:uncharacterized protein BKA55DRAFT_584398 [Fusarium redolens]|uniref:F-box domain-containing protein n=1 Tax=Fusarium redolens TaxID=48865 RepID=A0A9P9JQD5_FUSRE|nr:uncharacterized protein BKA55DRAFT_584398 [Fusarium redolens]KAH7224292.1 hypothetical protein BKA55DRAFT_584398 [Fusarium redolens]